MEAYLQGEPPGVDFTKQSIATDLVPICLGIGNTWDGLVLRRASRWPAGFSKPDWFSAGDCSGVVVRLEEQFSCIADVVGLGILGRQ
jgi:hypothetical protein